MLQAQPTGGGQTPLDFAYRVLGNDVPIGMVFDDGRSLFIQPVAPLAAGGVRIDDVPFVHQGPYLVVRGLANRLSIGLAGDMGRSSVIEYVGAPRAETVVRVCTAAAAAGTTATAASDAMDATARRVIVSFETGSTRIGSDGLGQLARVLSEARSAARITLVAAADRSHSPLAKQRTAYLRELLVSAGIDPGVIDHRVEAPPASRVTVIAVPRVSRRCDASAAAAGVDAAVAAGTIAELAVPERPGPDAPMMDVAAVAAPAADFPAADVSAAVVPVGGVPAGGAASVDSTVETPAASPSPALKLTFHPNTTVQSTLRSYLRAHGLEVRFDAVPVLVVEGFAEVTGHDVREVLRRALSRLGLRGELQGKRLLVVEVANQVRGPAAD